ncbi:hypothetical protein LguiB_017661 [Lonicera macranthoides]
MVSWCRIKLGCRRNREVLLFHFFWCLTSYDGVGLKNVGLPKQMGWLGILYNLAWLHTNIFQKLMWPGTSCVGLGLGLGLSYFLRSWSWASKCRLDLSGWAWPNAKTAFFPLQNSSQGLEWNFYWEMMGYKDGVTLRINCPLEAFKTAQMGFEHVPDGV